MLKKFIAAILFLLLAYFSYLYFFTSNAVQQVQVNLLWHEHPISCQSTFDPKNKGEAWFVEQFQFFVSDIGVATEDAEWQSLSLVDNAYQTPETVLLGVNCAEQDKQKNAGNWRITFDNRLDIAKVQTIRFTLGVPFATNHLNPVSQLSPLNLPSMFWVWQTGHKFIRAELASVNEQWLFHLGSTGCKAVSVMRAPKQACIYPNTFEFELPVAKHDGKALALNLNLASLLDNVELTQSTSCQSEHENENCLQLFDNLARYKNGNKEVNSAVFSAVTTNKIAEGSEIE